MSDTTTTPRTGQARASGVNAWLANENPVFRYSIATVIVFGSLYIAQSFGIKTAWPIALIIGLGFVLVATKGTDWSQWGKS